MSEVFWARSGIDNYAAVRQLRVEATDPSWNCMQGLQVARFEPDDVTGQEFAVYCDAEGRPRIKLCGRNQQAMSKPQETV